MDFLNDGENLVEEDTLTVIYETKYLVEFFLKRKYSDDLDFIGRVA